MDKAFHCRVILWIVLSLVPGSFELCAAELIGNGSFEADGPGQFVTDTGWDDGPRNGNDVGFAVDFHCLPDDAPICPRAHPAGGGSVAAKSWGAANGTGQFGSATQIVNLVGFSGQPFDFSAWLAGNPSDPAYAIISLAFFTADNATGVPIGSLLFDGSDQESPFIIGSANALGQPDEGIPATRDNWTFYRASASIPSDVRSAAVTIRTDAPDGQPSNGRDAFVDLVSLQVVPETSSAVLASLLGALTVAWRVRRTS